MRFIDLNSVSSLVNSSGWLRSRKIKIEKNIYISDMVEYIDFYFGSSYRAAHAFTFEQKDYLFSRLMGWPGSMSKDIFLIMGALNDYLKIGRGIKFSSYFKGKYNVST